MAHLPESLDDLQPNDPTGALYLYEKWRDTGALTVDLAVALLHTQDDDDILRRAMLVSDQSAHAGGPQRR